MNTLCNHLQIYFNLNQTDTMEYNNTELALTQSISGDQLN